jgi:GTP-binding protein LepA
LIPVINKIDLPGAEPDRVREEIEQTIGLDTHNALMISAKMGIGIDEVLEAVVREVPPPAGNKSEPLKALIFDSWFDSYRGVVVLMRVIAGLSAVYEFADGRGEGIRGRRARSAHAKTAGDR